MNTINERLGLLRQEMKAQGIDAYIIPSSDEHQSEYVADRSKIREWISGFTGSAGTVVVSQDHAGLWTDSRYFLQAETELAASEFELHKIKVQGVAEFIDWINENLHSESKVACDGFLFSKGQIDKFSRLLAKAHITLDANINLIDLVWENRPSAPMSTIFELDIKFCGKSRSQKIAELREQFDRGVDSYFISGLDDIAWLLNLRGSDVEYNPVFISYVVVNRNDTLLFVHKNQISDTLTENLKQDSIDIKSYEEIVPYLNQLSEDHTIHVNEGDISYSIYRSINAKISPIVNHIRIAKGIKNQTEINCTREAMTQDGIALAKAFMWLENTIKERTVKESELASKLAYFRSQSPMYVGESFSAIVGYKSNGAIIHYSPQESNCAEISQDGMLLVDSGGQYLNGTTDITRTFHLGTPTKEEKLAFTMVLKGFIALDKAKFPYGTCGFQLDVLARMHLWDYGMNFGHGTGHGVGFFLNVHEGPQGISPIYSDRSRTRMEPGMITSNEPGFYKDGSFGIRIENLILTVEDDQTKNGRFLKHETLTMYPIEIKLIEETLMTAKEKAWFNRYHSEVYNRLSEGLDEEGKKWLQIKCRPLN